MHVYDLETYPNVFLANHNHDGAEYAFEVSARVNQLTEYRTFLAWLREHEIPMVGYNNLGFDYPIIHEIILGLATTTEDIYRKVKWIIGGGREFFPPLIPQIDLFKIHHFDNLAKSTSLKALEINMRSHDVIDLPFPVGTDLNDDQISHLAFYNRHDVLETARFAHYSLPQINFRVELSQTLGIDVTNFNDTKIGKSYFINELERRHPGICFYNKQPRQTIRSSIALHKVILTYVKFNHPEFNRVLNYLRSQEITETKGLFKDLTAVIDNFTYSFGVGGIHGSVEREKIVSTDTHVIIDVDVTSYYPSLAIVNRLYPEHLGEAFCDVYEDLKQQRTQHAKGTPQNEMLKLALNGVYGDSNNQYSPFYDSQYTMSITLNGQLLLCMLAEWLGDCTDLRMLQINTDGLTVLLPREQISTFNAMCKLWEQQTGLQLEHAEYAQMFIRDVNSYIAQYTDGEKVKRIGAYAYVTARENPATREVPWHKDHSALVVPKVAEKVMLHGANAWDELHKHTDGYDFLLKAKATGNNVLRLDETPTQKTMRYYVATEGYDLTKLAPPTKPHSVGAFKKANGITNDEYFKYPTNVHNTLVHTKNQSKYSERVTSLQAGYKVMPCNHIRDFNPSNINMYWYLNEVNKLVIS